MASTPEIIIDGFFLKQGSSNLSRWKRRYFVLYDNNILTYADSKMDEQNEINLKYVTYVVNENKNVSPFWNYSSHGIAMQTLNKNYQRIWSFCFRTEKQRDLWRNELIKCTKYNHIDLVETQNEIAEKENEIQQLSINANKLKQNIQIKNRRWNLKYYKDCFIGEEAVKTIIDLKIASTQDKAIDFGNLLITNHIIQHVENEHMFKNGYFYYQFIDDIHDNDNNNNNICTSRRRNTLDTLDFAITNADGEQDILNLIKKCSDNNVMLDKLYTSLCTTFESERNHIKYEQYLDNLGKIDALIHLMKRHKFIHILNHKGNIHNYILNRFCQCINYNESQTILYNYQSLKIQKEQKEQKEQNEQNDNQLQKTIGGGNISISSFSCTCSSIDSMSITSMSIQLNNNNEQLLELNLQEIHNMMDNIQLFAALPISTQNINDNICTTCSCSSYLFRILPSYQYKVLSIIKHWDTNNYKQYTLYDLEQFIGLLFYKTIGDFFENKRKVNKIPIPFINKINGQINKFEDMKQDDNDKSSISAAAVECIERFDCIISGKDNDFPLNINMFNVFVMVWIIYRKHCSHIKFDKNVKIIKLKLQFFTKLINKLIKEFFMELNARKHLTKYMLILYYFASPQFNNYCDNSRIHINSQIGMFEMALNVLKDRNEYALSWINKRQLIDFLYKYNWIKHYNKSHISIELYLQQELKCIDLDLNNIYLQLKENKYYKYIENEIKIISGNVIFRQDHVKILGYLKNTNNKSNIQFEHECAKKMVNIAEKLSNKFTNIISTKIFHCKKENNKIIKYKVFELKTKSMDIIKQELYSMTHKNIKSPKAASIRDYMSCLVVFETIEEMISGYQRLRKVSKNYGIQIVHIANGISKKFNIQTLLDNFRLINIHVIFSQNNCKPLIGEIVFALFPIWKKYSMKKYIIDSYSLLLNGKTHKIAKSLSVSNDNIDYDWKIKKLRNIQDVYLQNILR